MFFFVILFVCPSFFLTPLLSRCGNHLLPFNFVEENKCLMQIEQNKNKKLSNIYVLVLLEISILFLIFFPF